MKWGYAVESSSTVIIGKSGYFFLTGKYFLYGPVFSLVQRISKLSHPLAIFMISFGTSFSFFGNSSVERTRTTLNGTGDS